MIKNKDEIVRKFCKEVFLKGEKHIVKENIVNKEHNKNRTINFYDNGADTYLEGRRIKADNFFEIDDYFISFGECEVLEDCLCPRHEEYDIKTGIKKIYYGLPKSFLLYLAGYSIEDAYTLFIRNNLYTVAETYYSNRYQEIGVESPIKYEGSCLSIGDGRCIIYCPLVTGVDVCYGEIAGIDSCMECEYMNKDYVSHQEGEEMIFLKEDWENRKEENFEDDRRFPF